MKSLPTKVAAVLFDMDDTLVNSEHAWFAAGEELWNRRGKSGAGKVERGCTIGDMVDAYVADFPDADAEAVDAELRELLQVHLQTGVEAMPGAEALLDKLHRTHPVTIASNSPSDIVKFVVDSMGWQNIFTAALGTEDIENPKPAPDLYRTAAERCGVDPSQCVVFEDSVMGATAGKAAGAFVVTVGNAATGIGDMQVDSLDDPIIREWNPERA